MPALYLAGPLFTAAERRWNAELASSLRRVGYTVFLPQEEESGVDWTRANGLARRLFEGDSQALDRVDIVIANMDGPDPDSGTSWECAYAYKGGKPVVTYRTDMRMLQDPTRAPFNLMLSESSHIADLGATPWTLSPQEVAQRIHETIVSLALPGAS
jgi:nucleoside 2-deoxyribosyltransferase